MALKNCKECGNEVSTKAKKCPNCGAPVYKTSKTSIVILVLLFLFILIGFLSQLDSDKKTSKKLSQTSEDSWKSDEDLIGAYIMMESFVESRLKSPSTADFPPFRGHVKHLGNQIYQINSYVDSQNSFGAMIRTDFSGQIEQTSEGNWKLISLDIK